MQSFTVVPMNSTDAPTTETVAYLSPETSRLAENALVNTFSGEISFDIPPAEVRQMNSRKVSQHTVSNEDTAYLTAENVIGRGTLGNFGDGDDYDKLKMFAQLTDQDGTENLADGSTTDSAHEHITKVSITQKSHLTLQEKIMQDGIQNTIAELSEVKGVDNETEHFKTGSGSIQSGFGHRIDDTVALTSKDDDLFASALEALPFQTDSNDLINTVNVTLPDQAANNEPSEAVELAIASEEEMPSPWIDVMALATAPALRTESWSELNAFPTAVHSLVDLVGPEPYPLDLENQLHSAAETLDAAPVEGANPARNQSIVEPILNPMNDKLGEDNSRILDEKNKRHRNVLQEITADADICRCMDCKCDHLKNCQNCTSPSEPPINNKMAESQLQIVSEIVSCLQSECPCGGDGAGGCGSCCVVICLKTLQQLQRVFNNRNCCRETSRTQCCKDKSSERANVSFAFIPSQVANNQ